MSSSNKTNKHNRLDIYKINELKELIDLISGENIMNRILVVFDIDDTLIRPSVTTGSDIWFNHSVADNNIHSVLKNVFYIYSILDFIPVEEETIEIIKNIIKRGNVDHFCLTSRNINFISHTHKHLRESGFGFMSRKNIMNTDSIDIDAGKHYDRLVRYIDNVCNSSGNDKGHVLGQIIKNSFDRYTHVIFIDDSISNVEKVYNHFLEDPMYNSNPKSNIINTFSLNYRYMDEHKNNYSIHDFTDDKEKVKNLIEFKENFNKK